LSNSVQTLTILAEVRRLSDDPTRELPKDDSFESRVLAELGAIRGEQAEFRGEFAAIRSELAVIRSEQVTIRADIATLNARQEKFEERHTALEEKVDSRLKETRPIWEAVQYSIKRLDLKFDIVLKDLFEVRANDRTQDKRIMELEAR
jgi:chromosome segregation ATPase